MTAATFVRTPPKQLTDRQQYRLLFAATFPIFFAAVVAVRLGRWIGGAAHPTGIRRSLVAEALATSSGAMHFAFMG